PEKHGETAQRGTTRAELMVQYSQSSISSRSASPLRGCSALWTSMMKPWTSMMARIRLSFRTCHGEDLSIIAGLSSRGEAGRSLRDRLDIFGGQALVEIRSYVDEVGDGDLAVKVHIS